MVFPNSFFIPVIYPTKHKTRRVISTRRVLLYTATTANGHSRLLLYKRNESYTIQNSLTGNLIKFWQFFMAIRPSNFRISSCLGGKAPSCIQAEVPYAMACFKTFPAQNPFTVPSINSASLLSPAPIVKHTFIAVFVELRQRVALKLHNRKKSYKNDLPLRIKQRLFFDFRKVALIFIQNTRYLKAKKQLPEKIKLKCKIYPYYLFQVNYFPYLFNFALIRWIIPPFYIVTLLKHRIIKFLTCSLLSRSIFNLRSFLIFLSDIAGDKFTILVLSSISFCIFS